MMTFSANARAHNHHHLCLNVHRIQQVIRTAEKYNRKVAVARSMVNNVVSSELGYIDIPRIMVDIETLTISRPRKWL